ncbi:LysR family transcriptional regulator [Bosea sp. 62]|uniref:LysR family transcriptional regulator n=1 Tax=unclassified Bosea (in: a-proteobacteria) TaxID=2653178 RepID=UPI00125235BE|nr:MULTISPECIES: LysR family transcriptional regulator [unclassified Bosea (in: a-proteobacteria)]CAD5292696.1 LysR family transcriptional regulator [Bosea sp. 7B]CAD5298945.1 LysR family transcriptional regulator [Bosea sp. 21B]CAD5299093.1 LysR family transcriptional regulator [Bosea sp. 46]VVT61572.1 LysR family transcriptional regulator [Bosea sp. EC-HK365B]VXB09568.1 LysR family transcriptional regulator [Bosea sp. 127]
MDRLDAMAVLLAVVEAGSLSAAARKLRMPLATVSRKIADLEMHLRARLMLRTRRGTELTEAGLAYLEASKRILEQVEEAERIAAGEYSAPRGELRLTASTLFGQRHVMPVALAFLEQNPEISLRLHLEDRQINLIDEHIDVAVRIGHLDAGGLIATKVGEVRRVICASPAYLDRRGRPRTPEDLGAHDGISFRGFSVTPEWRYRGDNPALGEEPRARLSVNSTVAAIDAALAGFGLVRVLSYQVEDELRQGTLEAVLDDFAPAPLPVSLAYAEGGLRSLKVRAFLDWAAPRLRARLVARGGDHS